MKLCGKDTISSGRVVRSLVQPFSMRLLVGEIVWCFVDLFDEIGDSWYIHWAVMRLFAGEFMLYYCDFRWTTGHILQRIYMGVWEKNMQTSP